MIELLDSVKATWHADLEHAQKLATELLTLAVNHKDTLVLAQANGVFGALLSVHSSDSIKRSSIPYIEKSLIFYRALGDSVYVQKNISNLSAVYLRLSNYIKAHHYSSKALGLAKHINELNENIRPLAFAHSNMGAYYSSLDWQDSSLAHFHLALDYFKRIDHPTQYRIVAYIGGHLIKDKAYEQAYLLLHPAYQACRKKKLRIPASFLAYNLGALMFKTSNYKKALDYFKEGLISPLYATLSGIGIADCFLKLNKPDSAKRYIQQVDISTIPLSDRPEYHTIRGQVFRTLGNTEAAIQEFLQADIMEDSLSLHKKILESTRLVIQKQANHHEKNISEYEKILSNKNILLWTISVSLLFAMAVAVFIVRRYKLNNSFSMNKVSEVNQQLQSVKNEKDQLNRQLVTANAKLASKNRSLSDVKIALQKLENAVQNKALKEGINNIQKHLAESSYLEKIWDDFFLHFESVHPGFTAILQKKYKLTKSELRLCAFMKMNLSQKEISALLNISQGSMYTITSNLKKKLHLPKEISVHEFIQSIEDNSVIGPGIL